jgi:hypothetical protein
VVRRALKRGVAVPSVAVPAMMPAISAIISEIVEEWIEAY